MTMITVGILIYRSIGLCTLSSLLNKSVRKKMHGIVAPEEEVQKEEENPKR